MSGGGRACRVPSPGDEIGGRVIADGTRADVEAIFSRFAERAVAPGFVYGVIGDGDLVATGAHGTLRVGEDALPDADSVFRIA